MNKKGYNVSIATNNTEGINNFDNLEGISIFRFPNFSIVFNKSGILPIPKINKLTISILKKLKKENFNLIITNTRFFILNHLILFYLNYPKGKVIHIEHGSGNIKLKNNILSLLSSVYDFVLIKLLKLKVGNFYGVSKQCNEFLSKYGIETKGILKSCINIRNTNIQKSVNETINITFVGRMVYEKGITFLLEAFSQINDQRLLLNVVGDGPILPEIKNKYSNNKNIIFYGAILPKEVDHILKKTHIFINPTFAKEGGQRTILEAGINKCAVISTNVGHVADLIVDNLNGLIIKIKDVDDIKLKIQYLIDNPQLIVSFSNNLFDSVLQNFNWVKNIEILEKYL